MKLTEKQLSDREILVNSIVDRFGSYRLKKSDLAKVLGRSVSSIDKDRVAGFGVAWSKESNGNVYYNVIDTVDYILQSNFTLDSQSLYDE